MKGFFYEMPFVICFRIDKWTESVLSITSSQECNIVQLAIPIAKLQYISSGFCCRVIAGSLMRLY